jgi:hypothetical protein
MSRHEIECYRNMRLRTAKSLIEISYEIRRKRQENKLEDKREYILKYAEGLECFRLAKLVVEYRKISKSVLPTNLTYRQLHFAYWRIISVPLFP